MVHNKIDTEGLKFKAHLEDVEQLNRWAFKQKLDVTKLSYHAFAHLTDHYKLLDAGSALGNKCGPILIAKKHLTPSEINKAKIGIPGKMTTANFLFSLAYPTAKYKVELLFSEIENAILNDEIDAGLIIHENRFTYQDKGLVKLIDCGEYWETMTKMPIPLGGIVVNNNLSQEIQQKINRVLRRSVEYAFQNPMSSSDYVKAHAQEMKTEVVNQHIDLYVNNYTLSLGKKDKKAVEILFEQAFRKNIIKNKIEKFFIH